MDDYTYDTKSWLDQRFKKVDKDGIYYAHQPIYGFRQGHSEPGMVERYMITYQITNALAHLNFSSLLDVGGAEGYKAALIRSLFDVNVRSVDLSGEACLRAKEIFDVDGEPVDIHKLPYQDGEFDVVLCSETLEHVANIEGATKELLRVCNKAVVITVPREPIEVVEQNIKDNVPHAHIHSLDTNSFDFALPELNDVIVRRFHNPFFQKLAGIADGMKKTHVAERPRLLTNAYNAILPMLRYFFGIRTIGALIRFDDYFANTLPFYSGMIFILLKDPESYEAHPKKQVSVRQIMGFKVPLHYPGWQ
ncbi:MAG: class I SAM-dependent methyltransferase [Pseudomonadota bacterium]